MTTRTKRSTPTPALSPRAANYRHAHAALERIRLLLAREIRWLRTQWREDSLDEFKGIVISDAKADRLLDSGRTAARAAFFARDVECVALRGRVERLAAEIAGLSRRMEAAGAPSALDRLTTTFGLTPLERDALLLSAAPALDETFGPLIAYVHDAADKPFATVQLAISLFAELPERALEMRDALSPAGRLRRRRLLSVEFGGLSPTTLTAALRVDERIVDYLRGVNVADPRVARIVRDLPATPIVPPFAVLAEKLAVWAARRMEEGYWPLVNVVDDAGLAAADIARGIGERLGLRVVALDLSMAVAASDEARDDLLRVVEREAALMRHAYFVAIPATDAPPSLGDAIGRLAEQVRAVVIVASSEPMRTDREAIAVTAPRLDASEQRESWRDALEADADRLSETIGLLAEQFDFSPSEIHRTVATARRRAELHVAKRPERSKGSKATDPLLAFTDLWSAARDQAGRFITDLAQHIVPAHSLGDLVLPAAVLAQIEEIAAQVKHRARVYEAWGFGARLSRGRATSACFAGPTGCGKSAAAEALATRLQLPLYRVDLAGVSSKYIGDTEKNLRKVFDAAEQSGAILFFDEADALFGKRTEVKDSHDRYANIEVNYLLQRLEDYRGLGILATNRKSAIDRAFLRRLRFLVDFPFPDVDSRRRIWRQVFPPEALVGSLDYEQLAQMEIAGGNIKNIAVNAAFLAAADGAGAGRPISMRHVLRAAEREYAKIDKAVGASELALPRDLVGT